MANEQFVFVEKSKVPSRDAWQAAIDEAGFEFQLDPALKPFEDSGYLPCQLLGSEAGFEIDYESVADLSLELRELARGRDYCITFRWGGSMTECASVLIASYALAKDFDALISLEGDEPCEDLNALLKETMDVLEELREDM